jgi:hypothetical protein
MVPTLTIIFWVLFVFEGCENNDKESLCYGLEPSLLDYPHGPLVDLGINYTTITAYN